MDQNYVLAEMHTRSMKEQAQILKTASDIEALGIGDIRDVILRQQMNRAAELMKGAAVLGIDENSACLGILSRSLLENLITSLWIVRSLQNAEAYQNAAKSELARILKINLQSNNVRILGRKNGDDVSASFLESDRLKRTPKRKSIEDKAREADVLDLYQIFYRMLSMETHGHQQEVDKLSHPAELVIPYLQAMGAIGQGIGQVGVWWLLHRSWPDNKALREVLGL